MDSFSSPSSGPSPNFSSDDFKDQLRIQIAQAHAEEFLESFCSELLIDEYLLTDVVIDVIDISAAWVVIRNMSTKTVRGKCFDKCITKPGSSLSGSESSCISRCIERYMEASGIIAKALFKQH
ncbi:mitochondrial import inner membrane translocase [Striga asiatica]|uniref:Mitochondrial import inner membrane translocase subunit n=1 Tax=Striga asiatica TaxID=4170 RepID=A0A5A7RG63_STRAF|nr:mitochondrial import inner membrane translocase [Striga asiatica]